MASAIQTTPIFKKVTEILDDEKGVETLLSYSGQDLVQCLTEQQRLLWSMMVYHFRIASVIDDIGDKENEVSDLDKPSSKLQRGATKRSPGSWDQMKVLTDLDSLGVPESYRRHIKKHSTDLTQFLDDKSSLVHLMAEPNYDEANMHLAIMRYTLSMQLRQTKDRARWLFQMLLYFDLAKLKYLKSTGRIGPQMEKEIWKLIKNRVEDSESNSLPLDQLRTWSIYVKKLNVFCTAFGVGSLFVLEEYLSDNFLNKRFAHMGIYHKRVFKNLRQHGLKEMAEVSRLNGLGKRVLAYLIEPFQRAYCKQLLDRGVSNPSSVDDLTGKSERRRWSVLGRGESRGAR